MRSQALDQDPEVVALVTGGHRESEIGALCGTSE